MANIETGNKTANAANIDVNYDLLTSTPQVNTCYGVTTGVPNYVGATRAFCENDAGILTGTAILQSPIVTMDNQCLQSGFLTPMFDYSFNGSAQDTGNWSFLSANLMVAAISGGFLTLNSTSVATAAAGLAYSSRRYLPLSC